MSLGWLVETPIAHRGLHNRAAGVIENSLDAALAAMSGGYAIECDVRASRDGEAFVFHDDDLARLTGAQGSFCDLDARDVGRLQLLGARRSQGVPTLGAYLSAINGRVPVIIEIESAFDGDARCAIRAAEVAAGFSRVALKSFDPAVISRLRAAHCPLPLGIVAQASYDEDEWRFLPASDRATLANLAHWRQTRPDFLSWAVQDLPHAGPLLAREALGLPLMTWTVRTQPQWRAARQWADQAIFEGDVPNAA